MAIQSSFIYLLVSIFVILFQKTCGASGRKHASVSDILDDLDLRSDNRVRPEYGEGVLEIHAFAHIRNIISISEIESTVTVSLLLKQIWNDPRLSYPNGNISEILIDNSDFMSRLWAPDTFIVNEVRTHCDDDRSLAHQIIRLTPDGMVLKTSRLTVTVLCPVEFQNYPFHKFPCDIELESFGHKTDEILYMWRNGSRSVDYSSSHKSLVGKSYSLVRAETHSQQSFINTGGSYSKLILRLQFSKLWLRSFITFFFPTFCLAVCSLLSIWVINEKYAASGIIANFIIAGFIILMGILAYSQMPQVPVFTPVDIHLGICLSTIFSCATFHGLVLCLRTIVHQKGRTNGKGVTPKKVFHSSSSSSQKLQSQVGPKGHYKNNADDVVDDVDAEDGETLYNNASGDAEAPSYYVTAQEHEEGKQMLTRINDYSEETHQQDEDTTQSPLTKTKRFLALIIRVSLAGSKWTLVLSFIISEGYFWYVYVLS
ncbi:unnamed protein product [Orchesella dallaii]|uniref:Neurotransmitter-gated ion-channel ligand-binding domain-containing protein n=1 Tax=Orchesella dallaii TaxID=48710 RepID=A0ABP1RAP7_9HEXA